MHIIEYQLFKISNIALNFILSIFYTIHFFLSKESKTIYFLNIKYLEEKNMMINKINKILILIIFISYCYTKNK